MVGFIKKLFGKDDSDDWLQQMENRSQKWQVIGAEIAQDCFHNGLVKGEIVKLSDITRLIQENHSYNSKVVENGFLMQMMSYIEREEVVNLSFEGGEMVFVHKDHVNDFLKRIQE